MHDALLTIASTIPIDAGGLLIIFLPILLVIAMIVGFFVILLWPRGPKNLTVQVTAGATPMAAGRVDLHLGQETRSATISPTGESLFPDIPRNLIGESVHLSVISRGRDDYHTSVTLEEGIVQVDIEAPPVPRPLPAMRVARPGLGS